MTMEIYIIIIYNIYMFALAIDVIKLAFPLQTGSFLCGSVYIDCLILNALLILAEIVVRQSLDGNVSTQSSFIFNNKQIKEIKTKKVSRGMGKGTKTLLFIILWLY